MNEVLLLVLGAIFGLFAARLLLRAPAPQITVIEVERAAPQGGCLGIFVAVLIVGLALRWLIR
jgi:uncharacterized membrane protein required for colicin V production